MSPTIGTSTPTELIPGNPGSLEQTARELATWGKALGLAAEGLSRIDTSAGWSGRAADQFRKVFDNQPGKWKTAADAFDAAAGALTTYAGVLERAQGQAATAIKTWNAGDHQSAQQTLNNARSDLSTAAATASRAIGRARDLAPPKPGWLSELGHDIEDVASSAWHETVKVGEDTLGVLASLGNAIIHDPAADVETAAGLGLIVLGLGGDTIGTAVAATGIGAIPGVAIDVGSTAAIIAGAGAAGIGVAQLGRDAAGPDRVNMSQSGSGGGSGSSEYLNDLPPSARTTGDEDYIFQRLKRYNGIDPKTASDRLHAIKAAFGLGGADNVVFDMSGNVYDRSSGELLGSLTQGGGG